MGEMLLCAAAAMVGAGFASGREIMQFFSRYGAYSWALIAFASGVTAFLIRRTLGAGRPAGAGERALSALFYLALGGGMTAAAGELAALTAPLPYARLGGSVLTLVLCLRWAGGGLSGMARLGRALFPLLLAVLFLCLRLRGAGETPPPVSVREGARALLAAGGYCGLNCMTAAGVLRGGSAALSPKEQNGIAAGCGLITALLLGLGNAALLPHAATLIDAPLPAVLLLRAYGKLGYYLAAGVLYLASATTLIAALRGLLLLSIPILPRYRKIALALTIYSVSLLGFAEIVSAAYPVLGGAYLLLILWPRNPLDKQGGIKKGREMLPAPGRR